MQVNKYNVHAVNPYKLNEAKFEKQKQQLSIQKDKIEISTEAKKLSAMTSANTERTQLIQQLKSEVESGTYEINAEEIAKSLLRYYQ